MHVLRYRAGPYSQVVDPAYRLGMLQAECIDLDFDKELHFAGRVTRWLDSN